jgi:hypothetical protein
LQSFLQSNEVKKDIALITGRKLISERAKEDHDDLREIFLTGVTIMMKLVRNPEKHFSFLSLFRFFTLGYINDTL